MQKESSVIRENEEEHQSDIDRSQFNETHQEYLENNHSNDEEGNNFSSENNEHEEELDEYKQNKHKVLSQLEGEKYHEDIEKIIEAENDDVQYNSIFDRINHEALTDDYKLDEQNFDELTKKNINSNNINQLFDPALYNQNNAQKFQPEINEKSKLLAEDKRNRSQDVASKLDKSKSPVEFDLYQDAVKRKEKQQKLEYNNMMGILLNASKTKISNNSHRIAINKIEKFIESAVIKFEKEKKKISFIEVGEVMTELKLFREIFPSDYKESEKNKKYHNYKDIKIELNGVKDREKRKKAEVDFYEQLWLILNSDNKEFIRSDIFSEFLKILFSPVASSVKEITSVLEQFLKAAFFLNLNQEEDEIKLVSPLTEKNLCDEDVWPLEKFVNEFLALKENILAYQAIHNPSKKLIQDLEQYKKQKLNFQPNAENSRFKSRSNFFEDRLPVLMNLEKLRLQVIEDSKKEMEQNKLKECTFKPKINKSMNFQIDDNLNFSGHSTLSVHDKLYAKYKERQIQKEKQVEEVKKLTENKELDGCTFKPDLISKGTYEKSINSTEKPKGFDQTVERMRKGIIENLKKKYEMKNIPKGENYEKVKNSNIKPFNISETKRKEEPILNPHSKDQDEDHYFQIQITITLGKERTIRIHRDDDPYEIAASLAKTYSMKDEVKDRLAKTILQFMSTYLRKNINRKLTRRVTLKMDMTNSGFQHSVLTSGNDINFDKI